MQDFGSRGDILGAELVGDPGVETPGRRRTFQNCKKIPKIAKIIILAYFQNSLKTMLQIFALLDKKQKGY